MTYENRQPPEGINYVERGWVRDFILLVIAFFAGLALLCWLLLQIIAWSSRWIPFSWEQNLTQAWLTSAAPDKRLIYLQTLTESLALAGGLSPDMELTVHYVDDDTVNALATLGGNIVVFKGLINAVESEQGLAFVIAHEIAHIQHRHPIGAITRGLSLGLVTAMVFGQNDLSQLAGTSGNMALLSYSREQESEADAWALRALNRHYGHVGQADELFRKLQQQEMRKPVAVPKWFASHPNLDARISQLKKMAIEMRYSWVGEPLLIDIASEIDNKQ